MRRRRVPRVPLRQQASGFTLIELLVVLVILPLIIGAIAEAVIVSLNSDSGTSARLSASVNAQIASAYFVRDAQGASVVTTDQVLYNSATTYSATTPEICGVGATPGTLLVALYHPAPVVGTTTTGTALDVGYWLQSTVVSGQTIVQVIRYACTAGTPSTVVISTPPSGTSVGSTPEAITARAQVAPQQFASAASTGWAPTTALTIATASTTITGMASAVIPVPSTSEFVPGNMTVTTPSGAHSLSCAGAFQPNPTPAFTSCKGLNGWTGIVTFGESITQTNMSGIEIAISEPASSYQYNLLGSPRTSVIGGLTTSGAALLTLGSTGIQVQNHANALSVNGSILADGGQVDCSGGAGSGLTGISGTIAATSSGSSCPGTASGSPVPDPIAPLLPQPCFPTLTNSGVPSGSNPLPDVHGNNTPGRYFTAISGTLDPGVYELDAGIGGALSIASTAPAGQGVLLFLPGTGTGYPAGCATVASPPTFPSNVVLPPLGNGPLPAALNNNSELRDMWLWQDVTDTNSISWAGNNDSASTCPAGTPDVGKPAGLAYAPGAEVAFTGTPQFLTGSLVAAGVNPAGNNSIVVSGLATCSS